MGGTFDGFIDSPRFYSTPPESTRFVEASWRRREAVPGAGWDLERCCQRPRWVGHAREGAGGRHGGPCYPDPRKRCDTHRSVTMTDLRLAARRLLATPLFTIFAVLSLAIGVAVTTAVYSI